MDDQATEIFIAEPFVDLDDVTNIISVVQLANGFVDAFTTDLFFVYSYIQTEKTNRCFLQIILLDFSKLFAGLVQDKEFA